MTTPPSAAVPDPADVEKAARAIHDVDCLTDCGVVSDRYRALAAAALTAVRPSPDSEADRHAGIVREATDLCWKATPYGEDEDGFVTAYLLPAGVVHRLLGQLQGAGYPAAFRAPTALGTGDREGRR